MDSEQSSKEELFLAFVRFLAFKWRKGRQGLTLAAILVLLIVGFAETIPDITSFLGHIRNDGLKYGVRS